MILTFLIDRTPACRLTLSVMHCTLSSKLITALNANLQSLINCFVLLLILKSLKNYKVAKMFVIAKLQSVSRSESKSKVSVLGNWRKFLYIFTQSISIHSQLLFQSCLQHKSFP